MDLRRQCCFECNAGLCFSVIRVPVCDGGVFATRDFQVPGQVFRITGSATSERSTNDDFSGPREGNRTVTYDAVGGVALSNSPFSRSDVIARYGLSGFDSVTAFDGVLVDGLYRSQFHAETSTNTSGGTINAPGLGVFAGFGVVPTNGGLGQGFRLFCDVTTPNVQPCQSVSDDNLQDCLVGTADQYGSVWSGSHGYMSGTYSASFDYIYTEQTFNCFGNVSSLSENAGGNITVSTIETFPDTMDGSFIDCGSGPGGPGPGPTGDGGPVDPIDPTPRNPNIIDPAVLRHLDRDPVHQCKTCGG